MLNKNESSSGRTNHRGLRYTAILGALATILAVPSAAMAAPRIGVSVHIALPPHVSVDLGNYEPYYVGRVFYRPLDLWRPIYSFPVETPYGVVYEPYVYDGGRVVCHDHIPGPEAGYGQFIIEGRGHYNPHWYRGDRDYRAYNRYTPHPDRGWHARDSDHRHGQGHDHGDRDLSDRGSHRRDDNRDRR